MCMHAEEINGNLRICLKYGLDTAGHTLLTGEAGGMRRNEASDYKTHRTHLASYHVDG